MPQPVTGTVAPSVDATETRQNGTIKEPAAATPAPAVQAGPEDAKTATPPQTFPALADQATASTAVQPSTNPAASVERKDLLRAVAASAPLRADPLDLSAQQAIGLPTASSTPAPAAASTPAAATSTPAPAAAAPPAAQLAPALLSLGQGVNGEQQMTLRLHPADLGMVQVKIDRSTSGAATVEITVEKADTMQALLRDQAQLHHTLDQAGVSSVGRTITFTMAPEASLTSGGGDSSGQGQGSQHGSGNGTASGTDSSALGGGQSSGGQSSGGQSSGGQLAGGRGGTPNQDQGAYSNGRRSGADPLSPDAASQTAAAKWLRVGLNITA